MAKDRDIDKRLFDFKKLFAIDSKQKAVLAKIAKELVAQHLGSSASPGAEKDVGDALARLVIEKVLELPEIRDPARDFQPEFVDLAANALRAALMATGQPALMAASPLADDAIKWILKKFNRCGGIDRGNPPDGPVIKEDNQGRHVVRYFIEEDENKEPVLPAVEGSRKRARGILELAFGSWELFLKLDIVRTGKLNDANLIVTGRTFGGEVPGNVLALTDIGPPGGLAGVKPVQLRMVFDLGETFDDRRDFEATAAHEMGHALGIRHRDIVQPIGQLMNDTLTGVTIPREFDLQAAVQIGWRRK